MDKINRRVSSTRLWLATLNTNRLPMSGWGVLLLFTLTLVWTDLTAWAALDLFDSDWTGSVGTKRLTALAVAFVWTAGLGGGFGTALFVEFNRKLFSASPLRPYQENTEGFQKSPDPRMSPWLEPVVTGIIGRFLFTSLAIILLWDGEAENGRVALLVAILGGYIALKGIKRMSAVETQVFASIHSIWGNGVSMGFAILAGWLFWRVMNGG